MTEVPAQIVPDGLAAMLTLTGNTGLTLIVTVFEVEGLPLLQVSVEVIDTVTASLLASVTDV